MIRQIFNSPEETIKFFHSVHVLNCHVINVSYLHHCVCVCVLQGTPEFVDVSECVHYFEWKTYVACRRDKFKPHKEVCTCCCDDDDDDEEDGGSWV